MDPFFLNFITLLFFFISIEKVEAYGWKSWKKHGKEKIRLVVFSEKTENWKKVRFSGNF